MKQKRIRWKRWLFLIVLIAAGAGGYYYYRKKGQEAAAPRYKEAIAAKGDLQLTILSTGTVNPQNRLEIKPPTAGRIESLLVAEGDRVKKGQILAWMSSTERAALIDSARSRGPAEVKRWEDLYRPTPIISPISGMIIAKKIEPGQSFTNAEAVLVISDRLTVKALVDETDIAKIKLKQKAEIVLDAYPNSPMEATVDKIAYDSQKDTNTVTTFMVDTVPKVTPEYMRSGMTANVTFFTEHREGVLLISSEALKTSEGRTVVLVPNPEPGKPPLEREVKTGISDGKQTEIVSGLAEDERVLVQEMVLGDEKKSSPFSPFGGRPRKRN